MVVDEITRLIDRVLIYVALGGQAHPLFASATEKSIGISRRVRSNVIVYAAAVSELCNDLSRMFPAARANCHR